MKLGYVVALSTLMVLTQGCEKVRESLVDRTEQLFASTNSSLEKGTSIVELAESNYGSFVNQRDHLVVVTFTADWCAPCRKLAPAIDRVSSEFGEKVKAGRVDVDQARQLATNIGVNGLPDVRFFHNGRQVHQFTGSRTRAQLRNVFQRYIEELESYNQNAPTFEPELQPLARELRGVSRDLHTAPQQQAQTGEDSDSDHLGNAPRTIRPMERNWIPPGIERR